LQEAGKSTKGKLANLQKAETNLGMPITEELQKITEGWVEKEKGILQILSERGFIDNSDSKAYQRYTMAGTKDQYGIVRPETSLKHLMSTCTDFEEEETMLQYMAREMGVEVDRTPKCHCEFAGEGVEYSWALSKNNYRQILLDEKWGKEKFMESARECISRDLITRERVQKFSKPKIYTRISRIASDATRRHHRQWPS
jgi:hypothetical protein